MAPKLNQHRHRFTAVEDEKLQKLVMKIGKNVDWDKVAHIMGPRLNTRQCRERYNNYLKPGLKHGNWSLAEDNLLLQKYEELGPKWSRMVPFFIGRSDASIKNRYAKLTYHSMKQLEEIEAEVPREVFQHEDDEIEQEMGAGHAIDPFEDFKNLMDELYFDEDFMNTIHDI